MSRGYCKLIQHTEGIDEGVGENIWREVVIRVGPEELLELPNRVGTPKVVFAAE